jgi:ectoine hydroxylase-related dioxygenase (phytanoyl-CoA dioxygenase family)
VHSVYNVCVDGNANNAHIIHILYRFLPLFSGKAGGFGKASSNGTKASSKLEGKSYAKILKKEGVLRLDNVLSPTTADALRTYLYNLRTQSEQDVADGKVQPIERYAHVLLKHNRCDLTIPLGTEEIVTTALNESLRKSPVGGIMESIFGDGAILHEFSCLMSDVGSQRQVIHPDTPFVDGKGPVLYTCFIALQDVTMDMGPTTWLPRTHTREAHAAFKDPFTKDEIVSNTPAKLGLLPKGSCGIFDSRLLHCGTANRSNEGKSRALFYFSFKNPEVGYTGNPASIRVKLGAENVPLGKLMSDLESFERGEGSPLIDELGRKMR